MGEFSREAEVAELELEVGGEEDVLGLDVSVGVAGVVYVVEGVEEEEENLVREGEGEGSFGEDCVKGAIGEVLEEEARGILGVAVALDNMWMRE